jgi:hypothetical protein
VVVSNSFSSATSQVANITVQTDLAPPTLTNVVAYGGSVNEVILSFDKLISEQSATNLSTYAFTSGGLTISSAALGTNGTSVILQTSQQQYLQTNTLAINGLLNVAAFPHPLYTSVTFQSGVSYYLQALSYGPVRYFRFDETNGTIANSDVSVLDSLTTAEGTYANSPVLGVPPLVPNTSGTAVNLVGASSNKISWVDSELDLTATNTTIPFFSNRTIQFWFKANSLPYATAATNHAPPLWVEGAGSRYLAVYLYGTNTTTTNPGSALLAFTGGNLIAKDGAGSPWGATNGEPQNAVYVSTPVTTNQIYHVVAVLEGNATPANGQLLLYTNGVLAASTNGAGYLYNHTGDAPRVGVGTDAFLQNGVAFVNKDFFDGVIDELSLYDSVLSSNQVAELYQFGLAPPVVTVLTPVIGSFYIAGTNITITWSGPAQLQRTTNLNSPFTNVTGATSPYSEPATNGNAFFRLAQ